MLILKASGSGHLQRPTYKGTQHFASMNITDFGSHILRASDGDSGVCTDVQWCQACMTAAAALAQPIAQYVSATKVSQKASKLLNMWNCCQWHSKYVVLPNQAVGHWTFLETFDTVIKTPTMTSRHQS